MDIIWFYALACIPVMVGGILWALDTSRGKWYGPKLCWQEWLFNSIVGFAMAGLFHALAVYGATRDVETWSGQLSDGRHYARWHEYYEYAVYRTETHTSTDRDGKTTTYTTVVFDHWEPTSRWHDDRFNVVAANLGRDYDVDRGYFYRLAEIFGGYNPTPGDRRTGEHNSRMIAGDPNDYVTSNKTGWIEPVTKLVAFENKIKATPTTFSYAKVPSEIKVHPYPANSNPFSSDRLLGTAAAIGAFTFDQTNARLGPAKKVNLIMVGFGNKGSMMAHWQEAEWIGGKKNDVVICFGGLNTKPDWVRAFGWTDSKTCLRQLETIVLDNGALDSTLPLIEKEIIQGYKLKDWTKSFAHIRVPAPMWSLWVYLLVAGAFHAWFLWWAKNNDIS